MRWQPGSGVLSVRRSKVHAALFSAFQDLTWCLHVPKASWQWCQTRSAVAGSCHSRHCDFALHSAAYERVPQRITPSSAGTSCCTCMSAPASCTVTQNEFSKKFAGAVIEAAEESPTEGVQQLDGDELEGCFPVYTLQYLPSGHFSQSVLFSLPCITRM